VARLSTTDYGRVLDVLWEAGEVDGPFAFPEPVLASLRRLIPCDVVAFHESVGAERVILWSGVPRGEVTPEIREASRRLSAGDILKPVAGARKYSDCLTQRAFHRHPIYAELARPLGVEDMFRLWLHPDGSFGARLEFDRPDWRFRESDRTTLDLLLPHLRQFFRGSLARRRCRAGLSADRLTPREHEILEHVAAGLTNAEIARVLWISPATVRKHLENAFSKLGVHTRTAAVAALRALIS
jgi:DNA-binding CsgD family transcriptional regulator